MSLKPKIVDFEQKWVHFRHGVNQIFTLNSLDQVSGIELFEDVYDMCTALPNSFSLPLFDKLVEYIRAHLETVLIELSSRTEDPLANFAHKWREYCKGSQQLNGVCLYLNTALLNRCKDLVTYKQPLDKLSPFLIELYFLHQHQDIVEFQPIYTMTLHLWRSCILESDFCGQLLLPRLYDAIDACRSCYTVHPREEYMLLLVNIRDVISCYSQLNSSNSPLYESILGPCLLERAYMYHSQLISPFISSSPSSLSLSMTIEYLQKTNELLLMEEKLSQEIFPAQGSTNTVRQAEAALISKFISLVDSLSILSSNCREDISMLYSTFSRVKNGTEPIISAFETHLLNQITFITRNGLTLGKWIQLYIQLYHSSCSLVESAFKNDVEFSHAIDRAFRKALNTPTLDFTASLAFHCDDLLSIGSGDVSLDDIELLNHCRDAIILFKYLDDKDNFGIIYSKLLSKRLLYDDSISYDAESDMLFQLKAICGFEYVAKMQRMILDMTNSLEVNQVFHQRQGSNVINAYFHLLTHSQWPIDKSVDYQMPEELTSMKNEFMRYYSKEYSSRCLLFQPAMSYGEMTYTMNERTYDLIVTEYQMAILLLLNDNASMSLSSITNRLLLSISAIEDALLPLISSGILIKENDFVFRNNTFSSEKKTLRFECSRTENMTKLRSISISKPSEEDKKILLQSWIVKFMKQHRRCTKDSLSLGAINAISRRYQCDQLFVDQNIDQLIEKQYLKFSDEEPGDDVSKTLLYVP